MSYVVLAVLLRFKNILSKVPAFASLADDLKNNVRALENAIIRLSENDEGITDGKRNIRLLLAEQTNVLAGALGTFALDKEIFELQKKVATNKSILRAAGVSKLIAFARIVLQEMVVREAQLAPYNITKEVITEFEALINEMADNIASPQAAGTTKKRLAAELKALINENRLLQGRKMKPLSRMFRKTDPDFFLEYTAAMKIRTPNTRHSRLQGRITDAATGKVLSGVKIIAEETDFSSISGANGEYRLLIPEKGEYRVRFEKAGYDTILLDGVRIVMGQATEKDIAMTAVSLAPAIAAVANS